MDEPFIYSYIIYKVKEINHSDIINKSELNRIIGIYFGQKMGLPCYMKKNVVNDLIKYKLIKLNNFSTVLIINKKSHEKIKKIIEINS